MKRNRGQTLPMLMVGIAASAGVGYLITQVIANAKKGQASLTFMNSATDLETRYRTAVMNTTAFANTMAAAPNATLNNCVTTSSCPAPNAAYADIELHDAQNQILIPKPAAAGGTVFVGDDSKLCLPASNPNCHWQVSARFRPLDAQGQNIEMYVTLAWAKPAAVGVNGDNLTMKPKIIDMTVLPNYGATNSCTQLTCDPATQVYLGVDNKNCPICQANPLLPYFSRYACATGFYVQSIDMPNKKINCVAFPPPSSTPVAKTPAAPPVTAAPVSPPVTSPPASTSPTQDTLTVQITGVSGDYHHNSLVAFTVSGGQASEVECEIVAGGAYGGSQPWAPCTSPVNYGVLSRNGTYTVSIKAQNSSGTWTAPVSYSFMPHLTGGM